MKRINVKTKLNETYELKDELKRRTEDMGRADERKDERKT